MNFKYVAMHPNGDQAWTMNRATPHKSYREFVGSMYSDLWEQGYYGGDEGFYRDYGAWQVYEAIGFELRHCGSVESILKAKNDPN